MSTRDHRPYRQPILIQARSAGSPPQAGNAGFSVAVSWRFPSDQSIFHLTRRPAAEPFIQLAGL